MITVVIHDNNSQILPKFDDLLLLTNSRGQKVFGLQKNKQPIFKRYLIHPTLGINDITSDSLQIMLIESNCFSFSIRCTKYLF